jgi:hypothetical protein
LEAEALNRFTLTLLLVVSTLCNQLIAAPDSTLLKNVLGTYLVDGQVNYAGLKQNSAELDQYLEQIAQVDSAEFAGMTKNEQLALLINLYNAATIKLVVSEYPVDSIRDIGGWFSGPFSRNFIRWQGETISLDTIEHETIRKDFQEPRIHFALVCAAVSCPPLRAEPFEGKDLDSQLTSQARGFLANSKKNRLDHNGNHAYLSRIFKWYGSDFEEDGESLMQAIKLYWPEADQIHPFVDYRISYLRYDWTLNDTHQ